MRETLKFIAFFMIAQSILLGFSFTESTIDLEEKVAFCFVWFLLAIFILIKTKK